MKKMPLLSAGILLVFALFCILTLSTQEEAKTVATDESQNAILVPTIRQKKSMKNQNTTSPIAAISMNGFPEA